LAPWAGGAGPGHVGRHLPRRGRHESLRKEILKRIVSRVLYPLLAEFLVLHDQNQVVVGRTGVGLGMLDGGGWPQGLHPLLGGRPAWRLVPSVPLGHEVLYLDHGRLLSKFFLWTTRIRSSIHRS